MSMRTLTCCTIAGMAVLLPLEFPRQQPAIEGPYAAFTFPINSTIGTYRKGGYPDAQTCVQATIDDYEGRAFISFGCAEASQLKTLPTPDAMTVLFATNGHRPCQHSGAPVAGLPRCRQPAND